MPDITLLYLFCFFLVKVNMMLHRNMHLTPAVGCFSVTCSTFVDSVRIQSAHTTVCVVSTVYSCSVFTQTILWAVLYFAFGISWTFCYISYAFCTRLKTALFNVVYYARIVCYVYYISNIHLCCSCSVKSLVILLCWIISFVKSDKSCINKSAHGHHWLHLIQGKDESRRFAWPSCMKSFILVQFPKWGWKQNSLNWVNTMAALSKRCSKGKINSKICI